MQFGLYLVKHGMIEASQFVEAFEAQIASRPQLGAMAIETGKLSVKQVFEILRTQADMPHEMFGHIAIEKGLLTEDELSSLLYQQLVRVTPMAQILSEKGFATTEALEEHFIEYRASFQPTGSVALASTA